MTIRPIQVYDTVALLVDLPEEGLYRGQVGAVLEIYGPDAFEVEFSDREGITYGLLSLRADQIMRLIYAPPDADA